VAPSIHTMSKSNPVVQADDPVAIFGGPYSNLEATRAFFDEMACRAIPPEHIVCTGDVVAYCADAAATTALVRKSGCHVVMGNVEESLAAGAVDCGCGFEEGSICDRLSALWYAHAAAQISADDRDWMGRLPRQLVLAIGGFRFAVVHGGVEQINRTIYASTDPLIKLAEIEKAGLDGVIGGHCGLPFTQSIGGRLWHNCGAIGIPANDGTPRVWYSVFRPEVGGVTIEHCALAYDHAAAAAEMRRAGLPEEYAAVLDSGLWVSVDTLPMNEKQAGGINLEPGEVIWQPELVASTPDDRRQLWPATAELVRAKTS